MILFNSRTSNSWLSAFHPCPIPYDGLEYPSVENFYQAMKCADPDDRLKFLNVSSQKSREMGNQIEKIPNWTQIKVSFMRIGLQIKYSIPEFCTLLLDTGTEELVHLSPWDTFWGVDGNGIGSNVQGKLTMEIRENLFNSSINLF